MKSRELYLRGHEWWHRRWVDQCRSDGHGEATGGSGDPAEGSGVEAAVEGLGLADLGLGCLPGAPADGRGGVQGCLHGQRQVFLLRQSVCLHHQIWAIQQCYPKKQGLLACNSKAGLSNTVDVDKYLALQRLERTARTPPPLLSNPPSPPPGANTTGTPPPLSPSPPPGANTTGRIW